MKQINWAVPHISRRGFLKSALTTALTSVWSPRLAATASRGGLSSNDLPVFEEIPGSASGITWVHDNAISPDRYLPETMGPGCAFLDYDNDGWMDIYLVNSGTS